MTSLTELSMARLGIDFLDVIGSLLNNKVWLWIWLYVRDPCELRASEIAA